MMEKCEILKNLFVKALSTHHLGKETFQLDYFNL